MIEDALQGAGIQLPAGSDVSLPLTETAEHTWVQIRNGPTWVDLDPTLTGSPPGAVLTQPDDTLPALTDDLRHGVEFDVLVERVRRSAGDDRCAHVQRLRGRACGIAGDVGHVTPSGLQTLGFMLSNLLGEGWIDDRPVLEVGSRSFVADDSVAFPPGSGSDLFDSEPSPTAAGPLEGEATAERMEVRVTPPGAQPEVGRRTVFDRLPADLRAAGELTASAIEPLELVDFDGIGSTDLLPMLGIRTFAIAMGPTSAASVAGASGDGPGGHPVPKMLKLTGWVSPETASEVRTSPQ